MSESKFRRIDLAAETIKLWGPKWHAPEVSYETSNGRKFELRTGDVYGEGAAGAPRLLEDGSTRLVEDDSKRLAE